ncbi:MAG: glycosyltransferase [Candidatus Heimdallarchaeota archaeon]|nr:glycosyltransferase [Candidatus Heimdallarchaeota archaeon]
MKISFVGTKGIPARFGGLEVLVEEISKRLAVKKYRIRVYTENNTVSGKPSSSFFGVNLVKIPSLNIPFLQKIGREVFTLLKELTNKADVIHIHGYSFLVPIWKLLGFKVILSTDGLEWKRKSYGRFGRKVVYLSYKISSLFADICTFDARFVKSYYKTRWNISGPFITYGIKDYDDKKFDLGTLGLKKNNYFLFVGRLVPEKGIGNLVQIFNGIKNPNRKLVILGKDPLGGKYERYLKRIASKNVRFMEPVFGSAYKSIVKNCYIQIRPSIDNSEGINPSLIEAIYFGAPLLVSDVPQNQEALGQYGYYFKANDYETLKNTIEEIDQNEKIEQPRVHELALFAKKRYNWDKTIEIHEKMYEHLSSL